MGQKTQRQRGPAKNNPMAAATKATAGDLRAAKHMATVYAANDTLRTTTTAATTDDRQCAGCHKQITERFLLKAQDQFWHEDCLRCGCCDCRLGEVGATMYLRANLILCKRDYLRLFGGTGCCSACNEVIPAFEMVMRAKSNVYHLNCFACQQCRHRFCVGDRFYLCENQILCEFDYEQRLMFAKMTPLNASHFFDENSQRNTAGPSFNHTIPNPPNALRGFDPTVPSTNEFCRGDDGSSGYGSPVSDTSDPPRV